MKTTMMTIRRFCTIGLIICTATGAVAQPAHTHWKDLTSDQRIDRRVEMMKRHLAITDAQATQIASVLHQEQQTLATDRQNVKEATQAQKMLARTQLQKDRLDVKSKVLQNLTPDQLAKAEELRKRHAMQMRKHHMRMREERMHDR